MSDSISKMEKDLRKKQGELEELLSGIKKDEKIATELLDHIKVNEKKAEQLAEEIRKLSYELQKAEDAEKEEGK